jgi:hypothetical protein
MENQIIFYKNQENSVVLNVTYLNETFWLTQINIATLFGVDRTVVTKHLINIYNENELNKDATSAKIAQVQNEGSRQVIRQIEFYNLDAIIAVGYRINSKQATQFRIWATQTLREFIIKGFVINDEMLKNSKPFGKDYFDELLERIREIRASERRIYQKLGDIFEQCSADYNSKSNESQLFFKMVQNKLHFAITGKTAAEIIFDRVDRNKNHIGLSTWKNAPDGKIMKSDVVIAKNYLFENEIGDLNLLVSAFLDLAEFQARRNQMMTMKDWLERTNKFLDSNSLDVLPNAGKISHIDAIEKASTEYGHFRIEQDKNYLSDLDKAIKNLNLEK